ncbi:hypothetical protein GGH92_009458 [Coemansia sp. RSA 2673]|nr:hypothetical protein GGH92_009458 [Coemansia sp. RSA 2673]
MTLFVGHLIERINEEALWELFSSFGTIANIDRKGTYAFIDLNNKEAAQRAAQALDKADFMGTVLRVELSNRERGQGGPPPGDQSEMCYNCQKIGHIAKNCP